MPLLRVTTTGQILAEELCEHFGGRVSTFRPHRYPEVTVYAWQTKNATTLAVLHRVLPYLVVRTRGRAEDLLMRAGEVQPPHAA